MTKIEWTGETWNPVVGCSVTSPGCTNCYAMRMANRLAANPKTPQYKGTVKTVNGNPVWTGKVALAESKLTEPLKWRKPRTVFVNSMGDLFHEDVPDEWVDQAFAVMALCPQHVFQCLTKRPERMRDYFAKLAENDPCLDGIGRWHAAAAPVFGDTVSNDQWLDLLEDAQMPLPNVRIGVSVEDQARAEARIPALLETPAALRFISAEPLLGPIDLGKIIYDFYSDFDNAMAAIANHEAGGRPISIDWVIAGGESGPGARPCDLDWIRSLRDQCVAAGVPFFFKQFVEHGRKISKPVLDGAVWDQMPEVGNG